MRNIDASLEAVEEILNALLDISRLDAGAMRPDISVFRIDELLQVLALEFAPMARERGLALNVVPCRWRCALIVSSCAACCRTLFRMRSSIPRKAAY